MGFWFQQIRICDGGVMVAETAEESHLEPQQETERRSLLKPPNLDPVTYLLRKATLPNPFQTATDWALGLDSQEISDSNHHRR